MKKLMFVLMFIAVFSWGLGFRAMQESELQNSTITVPEMGTIELKQDGVLLLTRDGVTHEGTWQCRGEELGLAVEGRVMHMDWVIKHGDEITLTNRVGHVYVCKFNKKG